MNTQLTRDEAIERLARRMWEKLEHIDPTGETWEEIDDAEKDMYLHVTDHLFRAPRELLDIAADSPDAEKAD